MIDTAARNITRLIIYLSLILKLMLVLLLLFLLILMLLMLMLLMMLLRGRRMKPLGQRAKQRASAAVADRVRRQIEATQRRQTDGEGARQCSDVGQLAAREREGVEMVQERWKKKR